MSKIGRIGEILSSSPTWALSLALSSVCSPSIPSGDEFEIQNQKDILLTGPKIFTRSRKYSGLWVTEVHLSKSLSTEIIELPEKVCAHIFRVTYADDKYYVLARLDQHRDTFDISYVFDSSRPLRFSGEESNQKSPRILFEEGSAETVDIDDPIFV